MAVDHNKISDELIAAFLDGNVSKEEMEEILSAMSNDSELREILSLSPLIDAEVESEANKVLPMSALAAANSENLCSFECESYILRQLDFDVKHWSLLETAKANRWVREEGTPLHLVGKLLELKGLYIERKYDSTLQDIEKNINDGKYVIVILDNNLLGGKNNSEKPSYHAIYVTRINDDGDVIYLDLDTLREEVVEKNIFLKSWKNGGNYMVSASKDSVEYNPQPINVEDIDLSEDLVELTEAIAENAHDIWARARMDEGWTYGTLRDDHNKKHPDLVPYSQLPESEKEYDRIMAMHTIRLVKRLGYNLVKGSKI